ncbi:hypothetical protein [Roseivirga sp.]|uniref:hypothetical protein n=1 Tax=Roseivirga sp. TaxID=1964215 RepID=UPI003B5156FE
MAHDRPGILKHVFILGTLVFGVVELILLGLSINGYSSMELLLIPFLAGLLFLGLPPLIIRHRISVKSPTKATLVFFLTSLLIYLALDTLLYAFIPELSETFIVALNKLGRTNETSITSIPQSFINLIFTIGLSLIGVIIVRQKKIVRLRE